MSFFSARGRRIFISACDQIQYMPWEWIVDTFIFLQRHSKHVHNRHNYRAKWNIYLLNRMNSDAWSSLIWFSSVHPVARVCDCAIPHHCNWDSMKSLDMFLYLSSNCVHSNHAFRLYGMVHSFQPYYFSKNKV